MAESLSIEETNALRKKLGLPPLAVDDDTEEVADPDQIAYENYQREKEEKEKAAKEEKLRKNIEKSKNRKRNLEKLQGKGLGEASDDEEEDSTLNWIRKSRKREKDLAARRAKELEDMDNTYQQSYDANQLAGLKVSHALSEFEEGGETILTLKDRGILEDDDQDMDELSNVNLEDRERLKKKLEAKKQKPGYNPYDDDQFSGKKSSILPQYEEEEEEGGFVIGQAGVVKPASAQQEEDEKSVSQKLKEQTLSYEKMQRIKDYYTQEEAEASFKKPKSKKKKKMRRKNKDEDDVNVSTTDTADHSSTQSVSAPKSRTVDPDANFVDDDDLQEALARARRVANKQKNKLLKKMTPEEIAKQLKEEENALKEENDDSGGLVLSETSEFVNSIGSNAVLFNPREIKREAAEVVIKTEPVQPEIVEVEETNQEDTQMAEPNEDSEMGEVQHDEQTAHEPEEAPAVKEESEAPVIFEEPLVSRGLAATLNLLEQKGMIAKPTEEQLQRDRIAAEQIRWQNEMRKKERLRQLDDQIERERRKGRGGRENSDRMRELEREREREREREERRRLKEFELAMENYKPEVHLEYTDDTGRVMKTVEAFKYMSHKFHGKTSGKTKTEKKMKKIEEERKMNMMT